MICILRHGETTGDIENRYGGDYDDNLTEKGMQQAKERVQSLPRCKQVFASPLQRAQQTGRIIADAWGVPLQTAKNFKERNSYGILTGQNKSEAKQSHAELVALLRDYRNAIEGAEPYEQFKQRILHALEATPDDSLVITHGGAINCLFRELFHQELEKVHDCALVCLDMMDGSWRVVQTDGIVFQSANH